ncbi:MAG TPA: SRPBCC family protein [Ktedonobacteraceae bacterium]
MARTLSSNTTKRAARNARNYQQLSAWQAVNMHAVERLLSGIGGATLTTYGLSRRDWPGLAFALAGGALAYRGISGHSYVYQGLRIDTSKQMLSPGASIAYQQGIRAEKAMTIERAPQELYHFWRHLENLPRFLENVKEVQILDETHSHWRVQAPAGKEVEWDAEIITDKENELLAWRSLPGSSIANAGSVHFMPAPGGRGTVVKVVMEYVPPAGRLGKLVAILSGTEPEQQAQEALRHFKEIMEAGEVPTTKGQPSGRS